MQIISYNKQYIYCLLYFGGGKIISTYRQKLKLARVENNLTQAKLAEKIGVTRQTIGLIEKGKYNPTINLCNKIARVLNKTLNDLFWDEEEK